MNSSQELSIAVVQLYQSGYTTKQIMKLVHIGYFHLREILTDAGVYRTQSRAATERYIKYREELPQDEIISLYQQGLSIDIIVQKLNISWANVRSCLVRNNIIRSCHDTCLIRSSHKQGARFFDFIDSEEKAYWLGLLYADGSPQDKSIGLNLKREDKDHVIKFASIFGYETFDYESNGFPSTGCCIGNVYLVDQLRKKGIIVDRPSPHLPFKNISQDLLRHFIRGFSDGDGSINSRIYHNSFTGYQKTFACITLCNASYDFLESILSIFISQLNTVQNKIVPHNNIWTLSFGGDTAKTILDWLYEPSIISLPRKFRKYQEIYP